MNSIVFTFLAYLIFMIVVGIITYKKTHTLDDYVLAGRGLNKWVAALSAQASDMSGWLLLGLPGAAYASGMGQWSIWMCIGLATGTMFNWQYIAKKLRVYTELSGNSLTLSEFFSNRFRDNSEVLRIVSAIFIVVFFCFYTASGLVAGGKLFESFLGVEYLVALTIGTIVILIYTAIGGFIAVTWLDFVNGSLMFLALVITPIGVINHLGGFEGVLTQVGSINIDLLDITRGVSYNFSEGVFWDSTGAIGFIGIISALAWGLGYFGQPHILARFMAISSLRDIKSSRLIAIVWVVLTLLGASMVGFMGIGVFGMDNPLPDSEWVFLELVQLIFHPLIAGILLAAVLAAIMSTVDSQLLVSSSALIQDFYRRFLRKEASEKELIWGGRICVLIITIIAYALAWVEGQVLELVAYAWAGFGATFGPLIIMSLFWRRTTRNGALAGIIVGGLTVILWDIIGTPLGLYEIVPGFILSFIAIIIFSLIDKEPSEEILDEFDKSVRLSKPGAELED
ncbi:sodium/proline symporter PutP [Natranaerofaba carboxydovora]|uniref:sodium/proline symporter PutP n=1 Tax=Natranaerofaba carboxydovora TaxID=2742683 RepID=UPI001F12DF07|nr:sodium/proline symporter PutP [Natranaerofaba carboxydovora]UMZ72517.1 Sodium/proline symporter [Natranaerofaba carboxydovora]